MEVDVTSYQRPQEGQIISSMVEYLQGIQMAKEATGSWKNRSGNLAIVYGQFTGADDTHMKHDMCSNTLQRQYY
jgi:hypothetical protein